VVPRARDRVDGRTAADGSHAAIKDVDRIQVIVREKCNGAPVCGPERL
jgi:hypothetical protein